MLKCGACNEPYVPTAQGMIDLPCRKCGSRYVLCDTTGTASIWVSTESQKPTRTLPTIGAVEAFDLERWYAQ